MKWVHCVPQNGETVHTPRSFSSSYLLFLVLRRDGGVHPGPGAKEFAQKTGREQPLAFRVWLSQSSVSLRSELQTALRHGDHSSKDRRDLVLLL